MEALKAQILSKRLIFTVIVDDTKSSDSNHQIRISCDTKITVLQCYMFFRGSISRVLLPNGLGEILDVAQITADIIYIFFDKMQVHHRLATRRAFEVNVTRQTSIPLRA